MTNINIKRTRTVEGRKTRPFLAQKITSVIITESTTNLVANVRIHSLSQIFKQGTEFRVNVPAPHHYVIPKIKQFIFISLIFFFVKYRVKMKH